MATLRQLYVTLNLQADNFNNGIKQASKEAQQFERNLKPTINLFKDLGKAAYDAGIVLTGAITLPIAAVGALGLSLNALEEQAHVAFTTLLGDGRQATKFLEELKDFAAKTPFQFPELIESTQRLMAMGFEAKETQRILRTVGDAAAGLGGNVEIIDRITLALSQMAGRGKVATQEMNQLTEARIPAWQMLAEKMNITQRELRDLVEKGAVPAARAIEILVDGMNEKFGGMMEKQSQTFNGLISTIKDETRFLAGELTEGLFEVLKEPMKGLATFLHELRISMSGWSDTTKAAIAVIGGLAAAIGPVLLVIGTLAGSVANIITLYTRLGVIIATNTTAQWAFNAAMTAAPWVAVAAGIGLTIKLFVDLYRTIQNNKEAQEEESNAILRKGELMRKNIQYLREHGVELDKHKLRSMSVVEVEKLVAAEMQKLFGIMDKDGKRIIKENTELTDVQREAIKKFNEAVEKKMQVVNGDTMATRVLVETIERLEKQGAPTIAILEAYGSELEKEEKRTRLLNDAMHPLLDTYFRFMQAHQMLLALDKITLVDPDVIAAQQKFYEENMQKVRNEIYATTLAGIEAVDALVSANQIGAENSKKTFDDWTAYQTDKMLDQTKIEMDRLEKQQSEYEKRANEYKKVWSEAVGNVTADFARGFADVIFSGKSFGETMIGIAKNTAKSMFEAFLTGLLTPITSRLASLGSQLGNIVFGGGAGGGGGVLGGVLSKGGILNFLGGGGGIKLDNMGLPGFESIGGGAATGLPATGLKGALGLGGGSGLFGLGAATIPVIGGALAGITMLATNLIGRGRRTANEFVQNFQNPFGDLIGQITDVGQFDQATSQFWSAAEQFAQESDRHRTVVNQAHNTLDDFLARRRADLVKDAEAAGTTNIFNITQRENQDIGELVNLILLYLQSNSRSAEQLSGLLPEPVE